MPTLRSSRVGRASVASLGWSEHVVATPGELDDAAFHTPSSGPSRLATPVELEISTWAHGPAPIPKARGRWAMTTEKTGEAPDVAPVGPARGPLDEAAEVEIEVDVDFDIDLVENAAAADAKKKRHA